MRKAGLEAKKDYDGGHAAGSFFPLLARSSDSTTSGSRVPFRSIARVFRFPAPGRACPARPHLAERFEPFRRAAFWEAMHEKAKRRVAVGRADDPKTADARHVILERVTEIAPRFAERQGGYTRAS